MQLFKQKSFSFWLLTIGIVFGLVLPALVQDAVFQDGMLYSCVSHNLSIGYGTFWYPQYSKLNLEGIPSFHEQPPLFFGLQALFFKVFGDSFYVERFYMFLTLVIIIFLLNKLWKINFEDSNEQKSYGWLPVLFYIAVPICFWAYQNNMIETTMSLFDLASVILSISLLKQTKTNVLQWLLSGLFIFLASFTKGIPGLFPLTVPCIYWLVTRKISFWQSVKFTSFLFASLAVCYGFILLVPYTRQSFLTYFIQRVIMRINSMPSAEYRLEILWRVVTELIPVFVLMAGIYIAAKVKRIKAEIENKNEILLYFLIGLSASLPLTFTMVQKGWYLVPSFPYYAICLAFVILPFIYKLTNNINVQSYKYKIFTAVSAALLVGVLIFTALQKGKISRSPQLVQDVYKIGKVVPKFSAITVPKEMYDEYNFVLQGFLIRYFVISIEPETKNEFFLKEKELTVEIPPEYEKYSNIKLSKYELYKKRK